MATKAENKEFEEYRRQMHGNEQSEGRSVIPTPHKSVRWAFGIFMILVYVGMGIALMCNAFNWGASSTWVRWVIGVVLVIYGISRGFRQLKGTGYYDK